MWVWFLKIEIPIEEFEDEKDQRFVHRDDEEVEEGEVSKKDQLYTYDE